jgi:hypothetical protein
MVRATLLSGSGFHEGAHDPNAHCKLPPQERVRSRGSRFGPNHRRDREAIIGLVQNADILFIESAFAEADAALAAERAHLSTVEAGRIAREAHVRRIEPFHFSPRYYREDERMLSEVMAAFAGGYSKEAVGVIGDGCSEEKKCSVSK